ncbi:MAG: family 20 glycosylhydrolase [Chitinophagaceae bacterium]
MKKIIFSIAALFILFITYSQSVFTGLPIPKPVSAVHGIGRFLLPHEITIITGKNTELKKIANRLAIQFRNATNYKVTIKEGTATSTGTIVFLLTADKKIPAEGYRLQVKQTSITITASEPSGIFYGVQSLLQLFPPQIEYTLGSNGSNSNDWTISTTTIEDYPRFAWRGLMLDVSRHFFTKKEVEDYIDEMSKYKFNILHWHLTDDQGWRIEIKSLPKLTSVGAWRVDKTGTFGTFSTPAPDEPRTYGGYYTQEDIKEVVQYAKDRYINIIPEIDIPGHSLAAIAAYPELSCTPGNYQVNSGEQFMVWPSGGHFYGLIDNTLCPANEKVYDFLDKVFTEVAQLFPFDYIHMGGDETARNFWEKTDAIKSLMQKENLQNLDEVQSYFVKRVQAIINSKKKKMIGWDEILEGGLVPNATVMSWRGMKGGIAAAKQGHEVIMSPTDFVYLDYMQGDPSIEPPVYASLRLKKVYDFEPVPDSTNPALIKGGQANVWTEQMYNTRHLQYMTWPRAFAVAEVLWSPRTSRNWDDFIQRVEFNFNRLDMANVKYSRSLYDPIVSVTKKDSVQLVVTLNTEVKDLAIHYSFDNSFPDQFYPVYTTPLLVPKDAATIKMITYRNDQPIGRMMVIPVAELKRRVK